MQFIRYIAFLLIFVLFQPFLQAQKFKFSEDSAYLSELRTFLKIEDQKTPDSVYVRFSQIWNSGQISERHKRIIISTSNNLLNKRAKAKPHFYNFLSYLISVTKSKIISQNFTYWLDFIEQTSLSPNYNISFIDHLLNNLVILNDSFVFYKSRAHTWKFQSGQYNMLVDKNGTVEIQFPKLDIFCSGKGDSTVIENTSGSYFPDKDLWIGHSGKIYWDRSGFSRDSVFASLNKYRIDFRYSEFSADTVEFTNKRYFKSKLYGHLDEKLRANVKEDQAGYPKFLSYEKTIDLKQVVPNIDYSGGFAMEGAKFYGYGDVNKKAELFIYKDKDLFAKASSLAFVFDKNNIIANNTHVNVFIDQDTIWHPGLNFNYLIKNKRVALNRSGGGLFRSKFYDTYHNLEIDINEIAFNLDDSLILFKSPPATTYRKAIFESSNYFSKKAYQEVALMDLVHPLEAIREISPTVGEEFEVKHLSNFLEKAESYCINMLIRLSDMGFVVYDFERKVAYPKQKLFDYIRSNYGKKDYDAIYILSEPPKGNNAVLNLKDNVLTVFGVESFVLSNNRKVGVVPSAKKIRIKKDLELEFDGDLQAGIAWFHGKNMKFYYDSFLVELKKIDSLSFSYQSETKNKDSLFEFTPVMSTIDSITGLLRIDHPSNKSGKKTYAVYPILESHKNSYVFYDKKIKDDTLYNKQIFYVENYPFEMDSLNIITKKNISVKGNLKSGGVFPDFDEYLVVQPDSSLGFVHQLDSGGMPLYKGLARYENTIKLNNSGLKGDGKVRYLNTLLYAEKFNFFPDSMNATANRIQMSKQEADSLAAKYPKVENDSVNVFWSPKDDRMLLTSLTKPFDMFEDKAELQGTLELKTTKLAGKGKLTISDAQLNSKSYTFYNESFKADIADFNLQPVQGKKSPFLTYNVNANVDFDKKLGIFNSNGQNSYIDFPVNQYKCYMNYFSWHMGINQIDIGTTQGIRTDSIAELAFSDSIAEYGSVIDSVESVVTFADTTYTPQELATTSRFISTHPDQDSLTFIAGSSSYDIKNFIIKAKNVKFIQVADAFIYPSTPLTIFSGARLKELNNARILSNRSTRYHRFYDATVNILAANRYTAEADYEYYNRLDSLQIVHFSDISVDFDHNTLAHGELSEKDMFKLSPEFSYFGKINLKAPVQFLEFDGFTKINHECDHRLSSYWLQFKSIIDPDSILIPLAEQPVDNEFRKLQTSLFLTNDSSAIYPGFLSTKKRFTDVSVIESKGLLAYNSRTGYFEITDSTKIQKPEIQGNYLSFHKKLCLSLGEGKMNLGTSFGQVKLNPVGFLRHNADARETQLDIMLGINFFFYDPALNMMASKMNEAYSLPPINAGSIEYQRALKELIGLKEREELMKDISLIGGFGSIPQEMNATLFFSFLKMKWNNEQNAWQSEGKIGLGNIKSTFINKMFDGYVEVKKHKSGDILNIYLEIDPKNWYFYTYTRGTLKAISSDNDFNNAITNLKDKYRKPAENNEEEPYMFFPATERAKDNFIEEMKKQKIAATGDKDINLDNYSTTNEIEKVETEVPDEEIENGEDMVKESVLQTEDLESEEINAIDELKKNENKLQESENESIDNNEVTNDKQTETTDEKDKSVQEEIKTEDISVDEKTQKAVIEQNELKENDKDVNKEEIKINDPVKKEIEEKKEQVIKKDEPIKNETNKKEVKKDETIKKEEEKQKKINQDKKKVEEEIQLEEDKVKYEEEEEEGGEG